VRRIFKYSFLWNHQVTLELPKHCQILKWRIINNYLFFWALIDDEKEKVQRTFRVYGTGDLLPSERAEALEYQETLIEEKDNYVWHVFEVLA